MTDLATLVLAVDSSSVPKGTAELDKLAAAGARAEAATDIFGKSTTATAGRMRASTALAVQQRAGLQQLGTQYSAAGTSVERFAAQTLQATQASVAMRGASSLLAGFLGGTFASVAINAVGAVASLAIAHLTGAEAKKKEKEAAEELIDATNDLLDATVKEMQSTRDSIKVRLLAADTMRTQANEARAAAIAQLELTKATLQANAAMAGRFDDMGAGGRSAAAGSAALAGANEISVKRLDAEIAKQTATMKGNEAAVRRLGGQLIQLDVAAKYDGIKAAADRYENTLSGLNTRLHAGKISYDAYRAAVDKATQTQIAEEKAVRDANKTHKEKKPKLTDAEREYNRLSKAADAYIERLEIEVAGIGKTAKEVRLLEIAREKEAARTGTQKTRIQELSDAREAALAKEAAATKALNLQVNIIKPLQDELALYGLVGAAREAAALELEKEAFITKEGAAAWEAYHKAKSAVIAKDAGAELAKQQREEFLDSLDAMQASAQDTAAILSEAFGSVGDSIGNLVVAMAEYGAISADISDKRRAGLKVERADVAALARAEIVRNGALISGVKSLFKEHSTAYRAMEAAEKAYAVLALINTAKSVAAGAAKMFSQLGVFAFPAVGAMIAVMAGLGFGGGGSSSSAPSAEDLQARQGTGTVLGDPTAKSASIANSIEILARNSSKGLDHSAQMVRSLHKIETGIGALAAALARQLNLAGGSFDTSGLGIGSSTKAPLDAILGIGMLGPIGLITGNLVTKIPVIGDILKGISKVLFSVKTTVTLLDQGIEFNASAIDEILRSGVDGFSYQTVEIKKKKKLLGIGVGGSTKTQTVTGTLDGEVERQIGLIIGDLYSTVVEAARIIGLDVGEALKTFQVEIGKISLKDLKGDEITAALQAIFSKVADEMAGFAVAGVEQFQKAGEGLFETLTRLAKDYLTIDAVLSSVGLTFGAVGASSIGAREALLDLSGGLDQFVDSVSFYQQNFLTEAERIALAQVSVSGAMQSLGLASVTTIDQFKSVVSGLDLTSAAGQELFTSLMAVAPAFFQVASAADAVARARGQLNIQLLQALGQSEAALTAQRGLELQALDASLRPLQLQVWAAQDAAKAMDDAARATQAAAQAAAQAAQDAGRIEADAIQRVDQAKSNLLTSYHRERDALEAVSSRFRSFGDDLRAFRDSLTVQSGAMSRSQALVSLMRVGGLAGAGNEQAMGQLPTTAREFLDISRAGASSLQQYQRDVALVAGYVGAGITAADKQVSNAESQLAALDRQVGRLVDINDGVVSVREAIWRLQSAQNDQAAAAAAAAQARENAAAAAREADRVATEKLVITNEAIAMRMATLERILKSAERNGALAVTGDADAPVYTSAA